MSTLLDALGNTLSLNKSGSGTKVSESRHKLEGTFVYFQGSPIEINHISNGDGFHYHTPDGRSRILSFNDYVGSDAIKPFDLESGVYMLNGIPIDIMRKVNKTYKKSFYPDAYMISCLDETPSVMNKFHREFTYFSLFGLKRQTIYRYKDNIFYGRKKIATVRPDKTLDISSLFTYEVGEALRDGTIKV